MTEGSGPRRSADAYRTIGEVAEELHVPQHVLRFWETRFPEIKPLKRAGGRRFYRPEDVALLRAVQTLLYADGYTVKGVQRLLAEFGPRHVAESLARSARTVLDRGGQGGEPPGEGGRADRLGPERRTAPVPGDAGGGDAGPHPSPSADVGRAVDGLKAALDQLSECRRLLSRIEPSRK